MKKGSIIILLLSCFFALSAWSAPKPQQLPPNLYTNWFKTTGGKEWILSLTGSRMVYQGQVWQYQSVKSGKQMKLTLTKGKTKRHITFEPDGQSNLKITEAGKSAILLTSVRGNYKYPASNAPGFVGPIIKQDTALLNGFINGYSPESGYKTGVVFVDNVITHKQASCVITIADDGSFSVKVPMMYPETCFLKFQDNYADVFLEPGKTLFQFLDFKNGESSSLYFGDNARLNEELNREDIGSDFAYSKMENAAAKNNLAQYSKLIDSLTAKNLMVLEKHRAENNVSAKAQQILKMKILYRAATARLEYSTHKEHLYRREHKTPGVVSADKLLKYDRSYFSFLNDLPLNDDKSLLYNGFETFINRFKYSEAIFGAGLRYSAKQFIEAFKQSPPVNDDERKIERLYTEAINADDANMILNISRQYGTTLVIEVLKARQTIFDKMPPGDDMALRAQAVKSITDADTELPINLMNAQDELEALRSGLEPFNSEKLANIKNEVKDESIYSIIVSQNNELKKTIARNRAMSFVSNELPNSPADRIFNDIINKYKGKVIYVDFWATWCGPCRADIEEIAPLKEELKKQDIAFVYITGTTSPLETYKNLAPAIQGEHYRVTNDQWNYLMGKFGISEIPHYVLVNKKSQVINPDFRAGGNEDLKNKLLAIMNAD